MGIHIDGLSFSRGSKEILHNLSFSIEADSLTAIIGLNGSGKSSLLNLMTGELRACKGRLSLQGRSIHEYKSKDLARVRAVLPQNINLPFNYKVKDIVHMGNTAYDDCMSSEIQWQHTMDSLRDVGMSHHKNSSYLELSGGEQRRVQLARVLTQCRGGDEGNKYLFLDEPTSSLDVKHAYELIEILHEVKKKGTTIVVVIHDTGLVREFFDDVIAIKNGSIHFQGDPKEVLTKSSLESLYDMPFLASKSSLFS